MFAALINRAETIQYVNPLNAFWLAGGQPATLSNATDQQPELLESLVFWLGRRRKGEDRLNLSASKVMCVAGRVCILHFVCVFWRNWFWQITFWL